VIDPIDGTSNYVRDIRVWGPRSRPSSTANRSPRPPSRPRWATCTPPTRTARTATESRCASVTCLIHGGPRWTRRCGGTSTPVTSTRRLRGDRSAIQRPAPVRRRTDRVADGRRGRTGGDHLEPAGEPVGLRRRRVHGSAGRGKRRISRGTAGDTTQPGSSSRTGISTTKCSTRRARSRDSTEGTTSLRGIGSDAHADGGVPRSRRTARAPW